MKFRIMKNHVAGSSRLFVFFLFVLWALSSVQMVSAQTLSDPCSPVAAAAVKMIDFAADPKASIDPKAIATLADFVLASKTSKEGELPKVHNAVGAYYEFDTKISFPAFMQYSYTSKIPSSLTSPASLRYSLWNGTAGEARNLPESWKLLDPGSPALIIRGRQHDGITPDLTTEVYYEYNLIRTLVLFNHKGHHVLISISKQANVSDVGKKGFILGKDEDWNYFYTNEIGSAKTGLGWVKSYIYDYFSVGVYVESDTRPAFVRSGIFQWIRAGWSGINFARPEHVIRGIKRFAQNSKTVLESPKLPAPEQVAAQYRKLASLPYPDLIEKYETLQQARYDLAVTNGKVDKKATFNRGEWNQTPKDQIIEALMLEYFKFSLGKPSVLGKKLITLIK